MAHKDTTLELSSGVTVLTGPNNSGKSAVVEALRSVAQNPVPHHVIRHGATKAEVSIELASGEVIEWIRSRGNTVYHLFKVTQNGDGADDTPEVYAKFGRTPPEDIRRLLRLDLVETESGTVDIHIGNQRYPIFLLDQTGSQAASFFAASTEAEYLLRIQQALKTKTDRARGRRKELLQECTTLDEALGLYLPLDDIDPELSWTEELYAGLMALQRALPLLRRTIEAVQETTVHRARKEASLAILEGLAPPPQALETKSLELTLHDLQGNLAQLGLVAAGATALEALSEPPALPDTTRLDALLRALDTNRITLDSRCLAGESLASLEPPPPLHEITKLEETTRGLDLVGSNRNRATAVARVLDVIQTPPETRATMPLQTLIDQWTAGARSREFHAARGGVLEGLPEPPQLHPLRPLEELTAALHQREQRIAETHDLTAALAQLRTAPEPAPIAVGDELLDRMALLHHRFEANTQLQDELASALASKRREIAEVIQDLRLCPACGHPLDTDHFLEETYA
jgi:exonuclease SbcC